MMNCPYSSEQKGGRTLALHRHKTRIPGSSKSPQNKNKKRKEIFRAEVVRLKSPCQILLLGANISSRILHENTPCDTVHAVIIFPLGPVLWCSKTAHLMNRKGSRICSHRIIQQLKSGYLCLKNKGAIEGMSHHITEVPSTFFFYFQQIQSLVLSDSLQAFTYLLISSYLTWKRQCVSRQLVHATHKHSGENAAKSQWQKKRWQSLVHVAYNTHSGCSKVAAETPISSLVEAEKKKSLVASRLSVVDSNKRSSRFTGAHWRTHSSEPSAQSQDPQSPQPIRGYTGGLELLVGGAKHRRRNTANYLFSCRWATQRQFQRTSLNIKTCIRWLFSKISGDAWGSLKREGMLQKIEL